MTGNASQVMVEWSRGDSVELPCPNCGLPGSKRMLLRAKAHCDLRAAAFAECDGCGCAFAVGLDEVEYAQRHDDDTLMTDFYVQVGAGIWPIVRPLARTQFQPGSHYLEVGCGFGFGLDYIIRERGATGRGIDPSPVAALGREILGLPIESGLFRFNSTNVGSVDLAFASEVIEHVERPLEFVTSLKSALRESGLLLLTTPDRAGLRPERDAAEYLPIISVGFHIVLQTKQSLEWLLRKAGFAYVAIESEADQLIAFASNRPITLEADPSAVRSRYLSYLTRRIAYAGCGTALFWGLASRAYQESVIDEIWHEAAPLWQKLDAACLEQFGFALDDTSSVPNLTGLNLHEISERAPFSLANLLYVRVLERIKSHQESVISAAPTLRAAVGIAQALMSALRDRLMEDLSIMSVLHESQRTLVALAGDHGWPDVLDVLRSAVSEQPASRLSLVRRCFVGLVNGGYFIQANAVRNEFSPAVEAAEKDGELTDDERDTIYALGMLDLQEDRLVTALARLSRVRKSERPGSLVLPCLRGELVAAERLGWHDRQLSSLLEECEGSLPTDLADRLGILHNTE